MLGVTHFEHTHTEIMLKNALIHLEVKLDIYRYNI